MSLTIPFQPCNEILVFEPSSLSKHNSDIKFLRGFEKISTFMFVSKYAI